MKVIAKHLRSYSSSAHRERAIKLLLKHGWNYFVCLRSAKPIPSSSWGLRFAKAEWLHKDEFYVIR